MSDVTEAAFKELTREFLENSGMVEATPAEYREGIRAAIVTIQHWIEANEATCPEEES